MNERHFIYQPRVPEGKDYWVGRAGNAKVVCDVGTRLYKYLYWWTEVHEGEFGLIMAFENVSYTALSVALDSKLSWCESLVPTPHEGIRLLFSVPEQKTNIANKYAPISCSRCFSLSQQFLQSVDCPQMVTNSGQFAI